MAEEQTNSRISELKARLEADPESRVFYQLGEELRKSKRPDEAETVLRQGLEKHPGYLSALISLGRVLKETARSDEAIEVLNRAFELDRQNVVVARLLGEVYSDTGEHVEAIKKYKLVAALHPADEEIQERIQQLEQTLRTEGRFEEKPAPPPPVPSSPPVDLEEERSEPLEGAHSEPSSIDEPSGSSEESFGTVEQPEESPSVSRDDTGDDLSAQESDAETAWPEATESPEDEQDVAGSFAAESETAFSAESEKPGWGSDESGPEVEPLAEAAATGDSGDVVATITMADLYARQGHVEQARSIYRRILDREPDHQEAQDRLELLSEDESGGDEAAPAGDDSNRAKVQRLEDWLTKVRG